MVRDAAAEVLPFSQHDSAELGKRQHFRGRIPHHSRPDENPQSPRGGVGRQDVPGGSEDEEQPESVEAQDRETAPSDRDGSGEYGIQARMRYEVEGESESRGCDDEDAQFHATERYAAEALA